MSISVVRPPGTIAQAAPLYTAHRGLRVEVRGVPINIMR
jgi:hypothetical protein